MTKQLVHDKLPELTAACHTPLPTVTPMIKAIPVLNGPISITSENCFHAFELSRGKEHVHNNLDLIYHLFNACLILPFSDYQKVIQMKNSGGR